MADASPRVGASMDVRYGESVEAFASFLREHGLDHVELRRGYLDVTGTPDPAELRSIADEYDVTYTVHAVHLDANVGNRNEHLREAVVADVKDSIDLAAEVDAGGVVVHGGTVRERYPDRVNRHVRSQAVASLRECVRHAERRDVPLCVENQPQKASKQRFTATPDGLASLLEDVGLDSDCLRVALDVGHAKVGGVDYRAFVDRFGDRIQVVHLHDNDGTGDDHDPLPEFRSVVEAVGAPYNVLEMKSWGDVERCVAGDARQSRSASGQP